MADPQVKNLAYQALGASLAQTAANPATSLRQVEMKPTPRSPRMGMFADAMMAVRDFANRLQIPQGVPLIGGEGVGSLLMGRAPEELVEMSYGNMPVRVNPYAGRTAGFMPEMKPGRSAQVADLLSLAGVPGGGRTAAAAMGAADLGSGAERALIGYHGTPYRFAPTPANPLGEFRASQIGTGEGAQAYGYGTYFAEAPGVAAGYRATLSSKRPDRLLEGGKKVNIDTLYGRALEHAAKLKNSGWNADEAKRSALQQVDDSIRFNEKYSPDTANMYRSVRQQLESADLSKVELQEGSLYTVDIPDEMIGKMLDYDAPLSQQPEVVKRIRNVANKVPGLSDLIQPFELDSTTGETINNYLTRVLSPADAANVLREAGIPGIRYLDQGSRPLASDAYAGLQRAQAKVARLESEFAKAPSPSLKSRLEDARQELQSAERGVGDLSRNIVVFPGEESKVKILSRE